MRDYGNISIRVTDFEYRMTCRMNCCEQESEVHHASTEVEVVASQVHALVANATYNFSAVTAVSTMNSWSR